MKEKQTQLLMLLAVSALVMVTAAGSWLHWRCVRDRAQLLAAVQAQCNELEAAIQKSDAQRRLALLTLQAKAYDKALPASSEVASVLEDISQQLHGLGVSERSMVTGNTQRGTVANATPIHVNFRGSFTGVFALLEHLHDSQRLIRVDRLVIQRDMTSTDQQLAVTANLRSFASALENTHE